MFNYDQPSTIASVPRMICIGDVHGDLGRLIEILKLLNIIDNNTQWIAEPKNTVVIQMGDQVDSLSRGTHKDWETVADIEVVKFMDQMDTIARRHGGRVISLLGNHEIMNVLGDFTYVSPKSMESTGGIEKRREAFRQGSYLAQLLAKRNMIVKIGNFTFCHGGILPSHLNLIDNNHAFLNTIVRKFLRAEQLTTIETNILETCVIGFDGIVWTRKYFELISSSQMDELGNIIQEVCEKLKTTNIVTGHNTVQHISGFLGGALWLIDAALSRSYDSNYNEVLEILYDDDTTKNTQARIIHIKKDA